MTSFISRSLPPLQDFHGLALEDPENANTQGLRDVKGVRWKLKNYHIVGHSKRDDVESHIQRMAIEEDNVRLASDLVVAQPLFNLLEECQEHRLLHLRGVGDSVFSARHVNIIADPIILKMMPSEYDQREYHFARSIDSRDDCDVLSDI